MAKLVCHAEKYKKGSVPSIERHNERKNRNYSNEEIDSSRTHLNYSLIKREAESYYRSVMNLVKSCGKMQLFSVSSLYLQAMSSLRFFHQKNKDGFLRKRADTYRISLEKSIVFMP